MDSRLKAICACVVVLSLVGCKQRSEPETEAQVIETPSGIEMIAISGGSFEMGSKNGQPDEQPVHQVTIAPFWMDRYEVTQELFAKFQMPDPSHFKNPKGPVDQANWTDAAMFCNERSYAEGLKPCYDEETWACDFDANGYRLPTEAEWEYACRAGATGAYGFGDNGRMLAEYAWYEGNSEGKTHTVGEKKANAWGLHDMHGNVVEWCQDRYSEDYYARSDKQDPTGPVEADERVLRGGSWKSSPDACRSSYRTSDPSIDDTCLANDTIGFRCVRRAPVSGVANQVKE